MKQSLLTLAVLATSFSGAALAETGDICTNCPDIVKIKNRLDYNYSEYYSTADAALKDDSNLATFRNAIITDISKDQVKLSYSQVWTALTYTDEDPDEPNNVILIYKDISIAKNKNQSGTNDDNYWNREHVWAKSHGFPETSQRGYTDIHHLRPSDKSVNTDRLNRGFDDGGVPNSEAPANSATSTSWEPHNGVKGDVARMMFYMDVRYDENTDATMPDLVLVDRVDTPISGLSDGIGQHGKLCTLIEWNYLDPIDDFERERNNEIFEIQGNRNPFIDNPGWVDTVYKNSCIIPLNVTIANIADSKEGEEIILAASTNGTGVSYLWEKIEGPEITIDDNTLATIKFTVPDIAYATKEILKFKVTITDAEKMTATSNVSFSVADTNYKAPAVDVTIAGAADTVEGNAVSLTASSTTNNVRYNWTQTGGESVNLIIPYKATVSFTAPQVKGSSVLTFKVTATDAEGKVGTETVSFKVTDRAVPAPASEKSGGSFSLFGVLSLLGLGLVRRKVK